MSKNIVMKISRPGYNVQTASDANLSFSSEFNTLKEYRMLKITGVAAPNAANASHGLDYPSTFIAFRQLTDGDGKWMVDQTSYYSPLCNFWIDDTNVYAQLGEGEEAYVMLFIDPLNE